MDEFRLFLDHYPFCSTPKKGEELHDVLLPIFVTHPSVQIPPHPNENNYFDWILDTCYSGQAITSPLLLASRYRIQAKQIGTLIKSDKNEYLPAQFETLRMKTDGVGEASGIPLFRATLWLASNRPEFRDSPWPISLTHLAAQADRKRSLIGREALLGTGLKIELHFADEQPSVSVWVPAKAAT